MYFFIVPPISFIVFDLDKSSEKKGLVIIQIIVTIMVIFSGVGKPHQLIALNASYISIMRFITIVMTFLVEVFVFYFYASSLSRTHRELKFMAHTDVLTNISNRRVLFEQGESLYRISAKYNRPFTLMIIDIDYFKKINDTYGHPAGDKILKEMTECIQKTIRIEDLLCRYGGEEFAILFKNIEVSHNSRILSILKEIESHTFYVDENTPVKITISAGAASCTASYKSFDDMVIRVDQLLYQAKESGRNCVILDSGQRLD